MGDREDLIDDDLPTTRSGFPPALPTFRLPTAEQQPIKAPEAHLIALVGGNVGRTYAIQGETLIGRAAEAMVPGSSLDLSRRHAMIRPTPAGGYEIEDLDSRNGTLVNGIPVQRQLLRFGDRIRIGGDLLLFSQYDPMEDRLLQAQRLEAIGQLTGGIAHDFNNVLAAAVANIGFLEGLPEAVPLGDVNVRECLRDVDTALGRAAELVQQLLGLARRDKRANEVVAVSDVLQDLGRLLGRTFEKSISLLVDVEAPLYTVGDAGQIHQLLMNLCLNARDAMPTGGTLTLAAREVDVDPVHAARLPGIPLGRYAQLSISDTGTGIPAKLRDRIFEPFFSSKPSGSGLGLSTVYRITKNHGGQLEVHSVERQGTCFVVYLPLHDAPSRAVDSLPATAKGPPTKPLRRSMVLIVDDEPAFRKAAARLLESMGYPVTSAADGVEALETFRRAPELFKVVLLDLDMPRMDGFETFAALRKIAPDVRVLICSGRAPGAREKALVEAGAVGHLHKPFDIAELGRALSRALTRSS